jgi:hypothetical protein
MSSARMGTPATCSHTPGSNPRASSFTDSATNLRTIRFHRYQLSPHVLIPAAARVQAFRRPHIARVARARAQRDNIRAEPGSQSNHAVQTFCARLTRLQIRVDHIVGAGKRGQCELSRREARINWPRRYLEEARSEKFDPRQKLSPTGH